MKTYECIIVGAGAAGIGMGCVLQDLGITNFCILDRSEIGASFLLWPKEMRLITPSFTSNAYGMLDLNAIALRTSPAYTLCTEHPTGEEYAEYLQAIADFRKLPVQTGVDVAQIYKKKEVFKLETSIGGMTSRNVIWAGGEFQYPNLSPFPGAEYCLHNSLVEAWRQVEGDEQLIIGGYESGMDAAIHLCRAGKKVIVIDNSGRYTGKGSSDPSVELSPYTKDRLEDIMENGNFSMISKYEVKWVEPTEEGGFLVYCENEEGTSRMLKSNQRPILATGFKGSLSMIEHLFLHGDKGEVLLTAQDESTLTPGLFVVGPSVTHGNLLFCFIYKFRQRFGVVAKAIAEKLGMDPDAVLEDYRAHGMMLSDLSCCGEDCQC
ncbi:NAD(P)/FAD-dependent oxidoreductase [Paenibacillus whitsoniae]|uniref:Monooxygenase n=1 Tax=Paenibacillus whitsoniae TaxID=2496558 RepID=A0A430JIZ3_9BACL|nr:NAD(P)/FAD-dependent oxidoreductase [Paenibacillus whitsoniae]RTE11014.1 monooxygenase [Paenibacillus whitsoniae]